ncbi:MAG: radical SAM protein, partial [Candidatus Schekmanbacteria bacterium]
KKEKIDLVGIYANTICFKDTLKMLNALQKLRERGKWKGKIAVGGPHTSVAVETIPEFVDHIVQGEGEEAILRIANGIEDRIIRSERITDLDSLPHPAWDYFISLPYDLSLEWIGISPVFPMNTSRGCPFPCTFCSVSSIWGRMYTMMSAQRIYDDIVYLQKKYSIAGVYFREDNFTLNRNRLETFCELLIKKGCKIKWACESRIDSLDRSILEKMYKAGCRGLYLGVESGSERMLSFLKKNITVEDIRRVFKECNSIGIKTAASVMVGLPTETFDERKQTLKLIEEIKPTTTWINIFVGIPGSELYQYILSKKLYIYKDKNNLLYLKGHNHLVDEFYGGKKSAKIPFFGKRLNEKAKEFFSKSR